MLGNVFVSVLTSIASVFVQVFRLVGRRALDGQCIADKGRCESVVQVLSDESTAHLPEATGK